MECRQEGERKVAAMFSPQNIAFTGSTRRWRRKCLDVERVNLGWPPEAAIECDCDSWGRDVMGCYAVFMSHRSNLYGGARLRAFPPQTQYRSRTGEALLSTAHPHHPPYSDFPRSAPIPPRWLLCTQSWAARSDHTSYVTAVPHHLDLKTSLIEHHTLLYFGTDLT